MVPLYLRARAVRRLAYVVVASFALPVLVTGIASAHDGGECPTKEPVGEYESDGEVGEYVTEEIPEYVTEEIPEYVTGEIAEYHPRADGSYISGAFPPEIVGQSYVEVKPGVLRARAWKVRSRVRAARASHLAAEG